MGLILDVVPNHMGISGDAEPLVDGCSRKRPQLTAPAFLTSTATRRNPNCANKVLLPILEDQYGKVLEERQVPTRLEEGAFFIHYYQHKLPVAPRTYSQILEPSAGESAGEPWERMTASPGAAEHSDRHRLPADPHRVGPRKNGGAQPGKGSHQTAHRRLYREEPGNPSGPDETVRTFNGAAGGPPAVSTSWMPS